MQYAQRSTFTGGVQLNSEHEKMTQLAASMDLSMYISRHNDPNDDYHLNMHQVVCIGAQIAAAQWFGGVTFFEVTSLHLLLNSARAVEWLTYAGAGGRKL